MFNEDMADLAMQEFESEQEKREVCQQAEDDFSQIKQDMLKIVAEVRQRTFNWENAQKLSRETLVAELPENEFAQIVL